MMKDEKNLDDRVAMTIIIARSLGCAIYLGVNNGKATEGVNLCVCVCAFWGRKSGGFGCNELVGNANILLGLLAFASGRFC